MGIHIWTYPYTGVTLTDIHAHTRKHKYIYESFNIDHPDIQDFETHIHGFFENLQQ